MGGFGTRLDRQAGLTLVEEAEVAAVAARAGLVVGRQEAHQHRASRGTGGRAWTSSLRRWRWGCWVKFMGVDPGLSGLYGRAQNLAGGAGAQSKWPPGGGRLQRANGLLTIWFSSPWRSVRPFSRGRP